MLNQMVDNCMGVMMPQMMDSHMHPDHYIVIVSLLVDNHMEDKMEAYYSQVHRNLSVQHHVWIHSPMVGDDHRHLHPLAKLHSVAEVASFRVILLFVAPGCRALLLPCTAEESPSVLIMQTMPPSVEEVSSSP
jgi:hypothetical protein